MVAASQPTPQPERQPFWQQTWFVESTWISFATKWVLTLGGKAAQITLILCTLYMSAELYPGVSLPSGLNLAVFIILSFALDMGGLGLSQVARTAREHGSVDAAERGEKLSRWLIGIMIAGLVTVSLEHAADMIQMDSGWKNNLAIFWTVVGIALSIARMICAVNYGHVVYALEQSVEHGQSQARAQQETQRVEMASLRQQVSTLHLQLDSETRKVDTLSGQVDTLSGQLREKLREVDTLSGQVDTLRSHLSTEQQRVSTLQGEVDSGHGDTAGLRRQLEAKQRELEETRATLESGQREVSTLRSQLSTEQQRVSTLQKEVDSGRQQRVSTGQAKVDSGHPRKVDSGHSQKVDSGQGKVVRLDAQRSRRGGQDEDELAERIRAMIEDEPELSDRAIATRLQCSPTTVGRKRKAMEQPEDEESAECVNE